RDRGRADHTAHHHQIPLNERIHADASSAKRMAERPVRKVRLHPDLGRQVLGGGETVGRSISKTAGPNTRMGARATITGAGHVTGGSGMAGSSIAEFAEA